MAVRAASSATPSSRRYERGQASVELVGALPAVLLVGLLVWQLALAGHAAWLCAHAARVAARAEAVRSDPERAARSALPRSLWPGLSVERVGGSGAVRVEVAVPPLLEAVRTSARVGATASLGTGR